MARRFEIKSIRDLLRIRKEIQTHEAKYRPFAESATYVETLAAPRIKAVPGRSTANMRCSQERFAVRRVCRAHSYLAASLSHRFGKTLSPARSPIDALIVLIVRCRLRRQIPVCWLIVIYLRVAVIPQRWPACGISILRPLWRRQIVNRYYR